MLEFLLNKSKKKVPDERSKELTLFLKKLKDIYRGYDISEGRKAYLRRIIEQYGYLKNLMRLIRCSDLKLFGN